jgi:hypothetical protein
MCITPLHRINKKLNNDYQVNYFFVVTFVIDGIGRTGYEQTAGILRYPDQMHSQAPLFYDDQFIVW